MVITQNLLRRLKLIVSQVRDFEKGAVIDELVTPASLVLICEDDHDIEIRRRGQVCIIGEPVRRAGSVGPAESWDTAGFLNYPLPGRFSGLLDRHSSSFSLRPFAGSSIRA